QYSAIVLGATGNVGVRIVQLLIKNPLCKKVVVVRRRKADAFAAPKVFEVVVHMDRLEEEVAPHAQGVDVALVAFGVGKGSAKMPRSARSKSAIPDGLWIRPEGLAFEVECDDPSWSGAEVLWVEVWWEWHR